MNYEKNIVISRHVQCQASLFSPGKIASSPERTTDANIAQSDEKSHSCALQYVEAQQGALEPCDARYTEHLKVVIRELFGIMPKVRVGYLLGRHKIIMRDDGAWEMDELQETIKFRVKGENVVNG